ncbi:unnamed protein product [Tilletia caries]|uniref:CCHC-type domain-containing protein n=1 Tax=Tilletia controversa TaxID=13291 RepID=A0A8X7MII3_9BASI|nr:hypothetical protein A4X06_0g9399 [Tilletia controversa]CAD6892162.1 unnamed protein product [Tilletia caries]CAD6983766.1 unnamed protein product [Tilletia controversa]
MSSDTHEAMEGAASAGAVPDMVRLVMEQIQRRTREGTPLDDALKEALVSAGGREPFRGETPYVQVPPVKKSIVDTSAYQLAYRAASNLPKLEQGTYSTWLYRFKSHLALIPKAVEHLTWLEYPGNFIAPGWTMPSVLPSSGYDPELDHALGTMMVLTIGPKLQTSAMREARKQGGDLLTTMHAVLKRRVCNTNPSTRLRVEEKLSKVRQSKESIQKIGDTLGALFEEAENAGWEIDEVSQVLYLLKAIIEPYHSRRSIMLDSLDKGEPLTFQAALDKLKEEEELFNSRTESDVSATARATTKDTHGNNKGVGGGGGGSGGGKGGGGGGGKHRYNGPGCWNCGKTGHHKHQCPDKAVDPDKTHTNKGGGNKNTSGDSFKSQ